MTTTATERLAAAVKSQLEKSSPPGAAIGSPTVPDLSALARQIAARLDASAVPGQRDSLRTPQPAGGTPSQTAGLSDAVKRQTAHLRSRP
jgi:hypothetical protein